MNESRFLKNIHNPENILNMYYVHIEFNAFYGPHAYSIKFVWLSKHESIGELAGPVYMYHFISLSIIIIVSTLDFPFQQYWSTNKMVQYVKGTFLKLFIVQYFTCKNVYLSQSVFDGQSNKTLRVLWGLRLEDTGNHYSRYSWWQMISRSTLSDFLDRILLYTLETCSRPIVSKTITEMIIILFCTFAWLFKRRHKRQKKGRKPSVLLNKIFEMS